MAPVHILPLPLGRWIHFFFCNPVPWDLLVKVIDKFWEDEGDLSRRALVEIYAEVKGEKLPWDGYRKAKYDEKTINLLRELCKKYSIEKRAGDK